MPNRFSYENIGGHSFAIPAMLAGDTVLVPPSYVGWPVAPAEFALSIEAEIVYVTVTAGPTWTLARGQESTVAASHAAGKIAYCRLTAGTLDRIVGVSQAGVLKSTTRDVNFQTGAIVTDVGGVAHIDIAGGGGSDMTPSGSGHAHGLAPDPGATAGTTRYLREDATWDVPPDVGFANPMTTSSDLIVGGALGAPGRFAKGAPGQALFTDATTHQLAWEDVPAAPVLLPSGSSHAAGLAPDPGVSAGTTRYLREDATWTVPPGGGGGMTDPTTTDGDLLTRASGALARVAIGATGKVLTVAAGLPSWQSLPADVGFANPMTTPADLIVGDTAGAPVRLGKGADGQVLTVDPATHLLSWATPSGGGASDMVASGGSHAHGLAPDPGGAAGSTKFLREDATWAVPAGGGGGGGAAIGTGAAGSEPSTPATGDLYLPNNGMTIERYSGSVWSPWGPIWPVTKPPAVASWTWRNQDSSDTDETHGGLMLHHAQQGGGEHCHALMRPVSGTWTAIFLLLQRVSGNGSGGVAFGDGTALSTLALTQAQFIGYNFTNPTSYSGTFMALTSIWPLPVWYRLSDDGTNRLCDVSADGYTWLNLSTVARTNFLTATEVGIVINPGAGGSGGDSALTLVSYVGP